MKHSFFSKFLTTMTFHLSLRKRKDKKILKKLLKGTPETLTTDTRIDLWNDINISTTLLDILPEKSLTWLLDNLLPGQMPLFFTLAISSKSPYPLTAFLNSNEALNAITFKRALEDVRRATFYIPSIHHPTLVSLALASIADAHIGKGAWGIDYGPGLMEWAKDHHPGVMAWAYKSGLPVLNCLPVNEAITRYYGHIKEVNTFRLLIAISKANSAHATLALRGLLDSAGETPEDCLFNPNPAFLEACLALPDVPHAKKRKSA